MPHGWSIAEMQLLLRDALVFEDDGKLILFAGVPKEWFAKPMRIENLPTYFGPLSVSWEPTSEDVGKMILDSEDIHPPNGVFVRAPDRDLRVHNRHWVMTSGLGALRWWPVNNKRLTRMALS